MLEEPIFDYYDIWKLQFRGMNGKIFHYLQINANEVQLPLNFCLIRLLFWRIIQCILSPSAECFRRHYHKLYHQKIELYFKQYKFKTFWCNGSFRNFSWIRIHKIINKMCAFQEVQLEIDILRKITFISFMVANSTSHPLIITHSSE